MTFSPADRTRPDRPDQDRATPSCARVVARVSFPAFRATPSDAPVMVAAARFVPDADRDADASTRRFAVSTAPAMR